MDGSKNKKGRQKHKKNTAFVKLVLACSISVLAIIAIIMIFNWDGPVAKQEGTVPTPDSSLVDNPVNDTKESELDESEIFGVEKESEEIWPETNTTELCASEETEEVSQIVDVTISAVGDCIFGRHQEQGYEGSFDAMYDREGKDYFLQHVSDVFAADDFTIANCECVLTESKDRMEDKKWNMKGRPEYAYIFKDSSIEAVSLGNNHIIDYNQTGAQDTMDNLTAAGVVYSIKGQYADQNGLYETTQGIKIGFVSVSKLNVGLDNTYKYLQDGLEALRAQGADLVFACVHWGIEGDHYANGEQQNIGRWCIDQGFDLVLGCHPHVLQGIEKYNGKYIVYSMGNFCFGGNRNPKDKESMIFQETFRFVDGQLQLDEGDIRIIPCQLSSVKTTNDYCPLILEGEAGQAVIDHINDYSSSYGFSYAYEP